jgi:DHA1 family tetracycline resistance protein-like MFS transporter
MNPLLWYVSDVDKQPSIAPILAVNFVGTLGFSIVLPFLVFLVTRLGGNAVVYGVIGATYSAFQLIGAPILGRWSDRVGRKKVLLVSQIGTFVSWGIFLVALALPMSELASVDSRLLGRFTLTLPLVVLFVARAVDGLTGGNVSVANAYLADITPEDKRSTNFGRMAVSANLGFVLGPALAGVLGATAAGESLPVLAAFIISGGASLIILVALRDPKPASLHSKPEPTTVRSVLGADQKECYPIKCSAPLGAIEILRMPTIGILLLLQGLVFLAFNFFYVAFPVNASTVLQWSLGEVGLYFTVMGLLMATVQGPVLAALSRRVNEKVLIVVGSALLASSFLFFVSNNSTVIYVGTALLAVGNGIMWPSLLALLSKAAAPEAQGSVQGLSGSITALASILGLLLGGALYQFLDQDVFIVAAIVTGLATVFALQLARHTAGRGDHIRAGGSASVAA